MGVDAQTSLNRLQSFRSGIDQVVESVAAHFGVDIASITASQRGRVEENIPRWVVMCLAQEVYGLKLFDIEKYCGLRRTGSIPTTLSKLKARMKTDAKLRKTVTKIKCDYDT